MNLKTLKFITALSASLVLFGAHAADQYGVLAYHSVIDESAPADKKFYVPQSISAQTLIHHFNWLKENGYNIISWQQVVDAEQGKAELPDKAVLLTFDDGYESMYDTIYPLLKAYNYPAVFAPVTSWVGATTKTVPYGTNAKLARTAFTTWAKVREMRDSGLVEIASHTAASHYGVIANPGGSQIPAVLAPRYQNGKYESKTQYAQRIQRDFATSVAEIKKHTGEKPRVMVWPYGQFNQVDVETAANNGMTHHFSLNGEKINKVGDKHVGRLLLDQETEVSTISEYLHHSIHDEHIIQRVINVRLDNIYAKDPIQQKNNIDKLIQRIYDLGVNTVYLQAYSDTNHDGQAEGYYFPTSQGKLVADLFGQLSWQLRSRVDVSVYAWLPAVTNDTDINHTKKLYNDLSFYAKFDGVIFSPVMSRHTESNYNYHKLALEEIKPYFQTGYYGLKIAQAIYLNLDGQQTADFLQRINESIKHNNYTVLLIDPYAGNHALSSDEAISRLKSVIETIKQAKIPAKKVIFDFQLFNWNTDKSIPESELISWIKLLEQNGFYSFGYYPDNFIKNQPDLKTIKPYVSVNTNPTRR
ncbi:poly-beta-1,6-N-acetyl-D-glucosamine N-deacetylase PgaB [Pasteurellaceae bacterium LIM206]|nr:poly-beta-1,6-N-acetyl-D-glucosamine N-deacetylase PgaB [Pasteurellaceae bacterium LIM206]